jgi:hypothetical protein
VGKAIDRDGGRIEGQTTRMTEEDIAAFLHEMVVDHDPRDLDTLYWYERSAEALPARLDTEFLDRFLTTLPIQQQVFVIGELAAFGHHEVGAAARFLVGKLHEDSTTLSVVAIALMRCGDPEGERILRALYETDAIEARLRNAEPNDHWRCDLPVAKALLKLGTPEALALRFSLISDGASAETEDRTELIKFLRALADPVVEDEEYFFRTLAPLLPHTPMSPAFLDEVLAPLSLLLKCHLLVFLASIGRTEVVETAARLTTAPEAEGFNLLSLGGVLLRCGDARGATVLEALYLRSLDRNSPERDTIYLGWLTGDLLWQEIGTLEALALRRRLLGLGRELKA